MSSGNSGSTWWPAVSRLPEPLASMVIASALTVDTALKQDDRGFN